MRNLLGLWVAFHSTLLFANVQPDDERLIASLIEQGFICQGLSYEQQQKALSIYLQQKFNKKKKQTTDDENTNSLAETDELKQRCINPDTQ
ncbi:hypothetical protein [Vibrio mimicus]|uniref:Uncharacterized protein n=1 Tax=Vibrio mimicus TaxID=674 RepID=A0A2J9VKU6_VIBMI|nr:hypothetical protein [Vibrio mimicus]KFE32973.1 hypothetical protein DN31_288 [Vibrio mimicus]PNM64397.1 hypothetical protein AL544_005650 [Vibrio mimicus]